MVKIRIAKVEDANAIFTFLNQLEGRSLKKGKFLVTYKSILSSRSHFCWVAEVQGKSAGFINIESRSLLHHSKKVIEILELFVDAKFRGHSIGETLVTKVLTKARVLNAEVIEVDCNLKRSRAHSFYLKTGFKKSHFKFFKKVNVAD